VIAWENDYVKMPEYRWGIFLNPADGDRKIGFGAHKGEAPWLEVPGEYRANLRRIIVTQGDTEPASVEQQRHLGLTTPSLYDLRNLFQANVEEGRHLWAMVYLPIAGVGSNYMCDLKVGDPVRVVGPYGATFLMPNHPGSSLLMICTGTGSAPMRAMTEWRRRRIAQKEGGRLLLFFGARSPEELPYFGPLMRLPKDFIDVNLAFSRVPDQPRRYLQDLIPERAAAVVELLKDENAYIYICGLKGMEDGVDRAFAEVCRLHDVDWSTLRPMLLANNRLHIETY
jgi:NAD(P)H-flavin reductase